MINEGFLFSKRAVPQHLELLDDLAADLIRIQKGVHRGAAKDSKLCESRNSTAIVQTCSYPWRDFVASRCAHVQEDIWTATPDDVRLKRRTRRSVCAESICIVRAHWNVLTAIRLAYRGYHGTEGESVDHTNKW